MTADWIISEADRLLSEHAGDLTGRGVKARLYASDARRFALAAIARLDEAAYALAKAEVSHRGEGDADTIAERILNGVSS